MKPMDKLKNSLSDIGKFCVNAYYDYSKSISDYADICEAKNKLYTISSGAFVSAFSDTAHRIAYCRSAPNRDTFLALADKAKEMLARGDSQSDVLWYFEEMLAKEMGK